MARLINDGGKGLFYVSKAKIFIMIAGLFVFLAYLDHNILSVPDRLAYLDENTIIVLFNLFGLWLLLQLLLMFFGIAGTIKVDEDGLTNATFLPSRRWKWEDIDQLHLGRSLQRPPFVIIRIIMDFLDTLVPMYPMQLRFTDSAYNDAPKKRWAFRPEEDGFVGIPLSFYEDRDAIFAAANFHHNQWWRVKNKEFS